MGATMAMGNKIVRRIRDSATRNAMLELYRQMAAINGNPNAHLVHRGLLDLISQGPRAVSIRVGGNMVIQQRILTEGRPQRDYSDVENLIFTGPPSKRFMGNIFVEGILDEDLTRDGTATLSVINPTTDSDSGVNIEVDGYYVPETRKAVTGSRVGVVWNGVCWRALVADTCTEGV
jgi:hypothetical protein